MGGSTELPSLRSSCLALQEHLDKQDILYLAQIPFNGLTNLLDSDLWFSSKESFMASLSPIKIHFCVVVLLF